MDINKNQNSELLLDMTKFSNFLAIERPGFRDRSQTLVRGGLMQKNFRAKNFQGPLLDLTIFRGPPFLPRKIGVNPTENHIDSLFRGKISVFFFQGALFRPPKFSGPPFLHQTPLTSVCERSLMSYTKPWMEVGTQIGLDSHSDGEGVVTILTVA